MTSPLEASIKLSILIATYNRAHIVGNCLQSLVEQTASQDEFEVIVVNNKCTDATDDVVRSFMGKIKNLRLIHEGKQGLSHARNAGLAVAQSAWLASLDDDGKARHDWVEAILREIDRDNFDAFGGPYMAWHHYGPAPTWFASEWECTKDDFNYYGEVPPQRIHPTGGNCVFRKDAVLKVGGFDASLGMTGNKCAYGEETKLFEDMRSAGFRLGSVPDLIIDHCVLPYKYSIKWRLKSSFSRGYALPFIEPHYAKSSALPRRFLGLIKRLLFMPVTIARGVQSKHPWQRIFLDTMTEPLWMLGLLSACIGMQCKKLCKRK